MRVGVVCEGSTDHAVLGVVIRAVLKDSAPVVTAVQPDFDALRARIAGVPAAGWTGVRAYLQSPASVVAAGMNDLLVVHVDADVRRARQIEKILREPAPGEHELDPLCEHVKSWFAAGPSASAVVVLPREATEAWILAAHTHIADVEAELTPAPTLVTKGLVDGTDRGDPNKQAETYEALARPLASLVADRKRLARVPELARFVDKLRSHAHTLRRARKTRPAS